MFITKSKSKNTILYYVAYSKRNGNKVSTHIYEALGSADAIRKRVGNPTLDVESWAKEYAKALTLSLKETQQRITISYSPMTRLSHDSKRNLQVGYFFIQHILKECGLNKIVQKINDENRFKFDLREIISYLVSSRILSPHSKLSTYAYCQNFFDSPSFNLHDIYRGLEKMHEYKDFIQEVLYSETHRLFKRNSTILYYDCTNYFFELEDEDGIRKYGKSKENRPNPIIQMGLFIDQYGLPLAFDLFNGNQNEQTTLKPLEQKIIRDYGLSKVVVCTDAGLNSNANKKLNNVGNRAFIMTYSIKKTKQHIKEWILEDNGWKRMDDHKIYNLSDIKNLENDYHLYYKERWINENGMEERIVVSYSPEYASYQKNIRSRHVERAVKIIEEGKKIRLSKKQTDYKRLIAIEHTTEGGEVAENIHLALDTHKINEESQWDGLYCVSTNLEDNIDTILQVHRQRWKIEESFRILKTEFKARPVYLSKETRIHAHFLTCFMALLVQRILEKRLPQYTTREIINTLRGMSVCEVGNKQYIPTYTRTLITDQLHEKFKFNTDYEVMSYKTLKSISQKTKK